MTSVACLLMLPMTSTVVLERMRSTSLNHDDNMIYKQPGFMSSPLASVSIIGERGEHCLTQYYHVLLDTLSKFHETRTKAASEPVYLILAHDTGRNPHPNPS